MSKKIYVLELEVSSSVVEYADVPVKAESYKEAVKLFEEDIYNHEWTNWKKSPRHESEVLDYEIVDSRIESPKEVSSE